MVRSVAQRRVSNHGPLAALSPAARPSAFALRATADKSRRRFAPPQDEDELSCKRPARWAPGAIPTVDFLLYRFGAAVKKMGVKNKDWTQRRTQHRSPNSAQRNAETPSPEY